MLGISSALLSSIPGVSHRFFGRIGGTSPHPYAALNTSHDVDDAPARVDENLARVRFQLGTGKDTLFTATQVHGAAVIVVDTDSELDVIRSIHADALLTRVAGHAVGVRTADCAPILMAVDDGSAVIAVHAGWRGAVDGVIEASILALGVDPARVVAAIGPCIGLEAFEVGPEVLAQAGNVVSLSGLVRSGVGDRSFLDLAGLCRALVLKAGVSRVDVVGGCTVTQESMYFSHRRSHGHTGRQMSAIARATPPDLDDESFA